MTLALNWCAKALKVRNTLIKSDLLTKDIYSYQGAIYKYFGQK